MPQKRKLENRMTATEIVNRAQGGKPVLTEKEHSALMLRERTAERERRAHAKERVRKSRERKRMNKGGAGDVIPDGGDGDE